MGWSQVHTVDALPEQVTADAEGNIVRPDRLLERDMLEGTVRPQP